MPRTTNQPSIVTIAIHFDVAPKAAVRKWLQEAATVIRDQKALSADPDQLERLAGLLGASNAKATKAPFQHRDVCAGGVFCDCPNAPEPTTRKAPTRVGKAGVEITWNGETTRFESMSAAATWLADKFPDATRVNAYKQLAAAKKSANARSFIMADIAAGRLEGVEVTFDQ